MVLPDVPSSEGGMGVETANQPLHLIATGDGWLGLAKHDPADVDDGLSHPRAAREMQLSRAALPGAAGRKQVFQQRERSVGCALLLDDELAGTVAQLCSEIAVGQAAADEGFEFVLVADDDGGVARRAACATTSRKFQVLGPNETAAP